MNYNFFNKDGWTRSNTTTPSEFPSRSEMIDYIRHHFRYDTMSSWNRSTAWANNVKIYNLGLDKELTDKAYNFISADDNWGIRSDIEYYISEFTAKWPFFTAGFNGRSSGYLVMYKRDYAKNGKLTTYPGRGIDEDLDFDELEDSEIREKFEYIKDFDTLCDNIREVFIDNITRTKTINVTVYSPKRQTITIDPALICANLNEPEDESDYEEMITAELPETTIEVYEDKHGKITAYVPELDIETEGEYIDHAILKAQKAIFDRIRENR